MKRVTRLSLFLPLAVVCFAQDSPFAGPVTGWVYDPPSHSVRTISGLVGAARLDGVVVGEISWASVAPNGSTAIVQKDDELRLFIARDRGVHATSAPIEGAIGRPELAVWAPDSSAVAVYSPAIPAVQWIQIDRDASSADPPISLSGVESPINCFGADAVSRRVFLAVAGDGLYRVSASEGPVLLASLPDISAIAVDLGGRRTWIADRANAKLVEIVERESMPVVRTLITDAERVQDVAAIAISEDRRTLYLADRQTSRLYSFDRRSTSFAPEIDLPVSPRAMTSVGRPSVLLLGERSQAGDPLHLLVLNPGAPALFFIPGGDAQ